MPHFHKPRDDRTSRAFFTSSIILLTSFVSYLTPQLSVKIAEVFHFSYSLTILYILRTKSPLRGLSFTNSKAFAKSSGCNLRDPSTALGMTKGGLSG